MTERRRGLGVAEITRDHVRKDVSRWRLGASCDRVPSCWSHVVFTFDSGFTFLF
jgi:hypothetical protein